MRIIHIITRLILGGAQENTILTCEGLHRRGHEVTLITGPALGPEGQLLERAKSGGYKVMVLNHLRRAINPVHDISAYYQLKRLIAEINPDIVHTHSAKAGILGRWAAAAVRSRASQSCCSRVSQLRSAQLAHCALPRIVHTIHGLAFHPYQSALLNRIYIAVEKSAARQTDAFISVADAMTQKALASGIGQPGQFTRIFSGLEIDNFPADFPREEIRRVRREYAIPDVAVVITTLARLFELKGHEYIIESAKDLAKRHPQVIWMFIGDGLLRSRLENQIAAAGLKDRFRLTGLVEPERIPLLLSAGDILVHCSLREGLARALPQALLCGKGVISFDVDGAAEVIINNETGLLVPPQDIAALTAAEEKLIADAELRRRLGAAGRELARREFDKELMVDKIERLYKSLTI